MAPSRRVVLVVLAVVSLSASAGCIGIASDVTTSPDQPSTPTAAAEPVTAPPSATPPSSERTLTVTVVGVVDGDTLKIEYANGTRDTVRLLGVDTPEVHAENTPEEFEGVPETEAGRACLRRWGERASGYVKARLLDEEVTIAFDANEPRRGYYGRLLAYVYVDGAAFNYGLVTRGYARVYESNFVYRDRYETAEMAARDAGAGLWTCRVASDGGRTVTETVTGTASESGVVVADVHADAAGADGDNLNDEYVVLRNRGSEAVDVSGWTVSDAAGHVYTVPDGAIIAAGERLVIHTGSGEDTQTDRYWGAGSPVWNNDGDTVVVRNAAGDVVDRYTYE